jgi:hypothetical protein
MWRCKYAGDVAGRRNFFIGVNFMTRLLMRLAVVGACCVLVGHVANRHVVAQEVEPAPQVIEAPSLVEPPADTLSELVDAAAEAPAPVPSPSEELADARNELRQRARELEESFAADRPQLMAWKEYLKWDKLLLQLSDDAPTDADSLETLNQILRRLRDEEQPVFKGEPFTNLAGAIERYRDIVSWSAQVASESEAEVEKDNDERLKSLKEYFSPQAPTLTTEAARKISEILNAFNLQRILPDLVAVIRDRYLHPNVWLHISARMIARVPTEPVDTTQPVNDCILGTTICGVAHTCGKATLGLCDSPDHIDLVATLVGQINSRTTGYKKPVQIQSRSTTPFHAVKRAEISDEAFTSRGAVAHADTHTTILSIVKVGKQFLHRLIVKIAWKRVRQQKGQAEAIASRHAEKAIEVRFDERLDTNLDNAREKYEKIRDTLKQLQLFPNALRFSSTTAMARIAATFAKPHQLGAPGPPPAFSPANDVTVQIHESALNNAMPKILFDVKISQNSDDAAPQLSGQVPKLIRDQLAKAWEGESAQESETPWSMDLDTASPATLHFGDGKLILRVRASHIKVGERDYSNWDILGTYSVTSDGAQVLLSREGEVDALPAGYDPVDPRPLTAEEAGVRQELTKDMNSRVVAGDLLPPEFQIPLVDFPDLGALQIKEIIVGGGWLTIGCVLP